MTTTCIAAILEEGNLEVVSLTYRRGGYRVDLRSPSAHGELLGTRKSWLVNDAALRAYVEGVRNGVLIGFAR